MPAYLDLISADATVDANSIHHARDHLHPPLQRFCQLRYHLEAQKRKHKMRHTRASTIVKEIHGNSVHHMDPVEAGQVSLTLWSFSAAKRLGRRAPGGSSGSLERSGTTTSSIAEPAQGRMDAVSPRTCLMSAAGLLKSSGESSPSEMLKLEAVLTSMWSRSGSSESTNRLGCCGSDGGSSRRSRTTTRPPPIGCRMDTSNYSREAQHYQPAPVPKLALTCPFTNKAISGEEGALTTDSQDLDGRCKMPNGMPLV
jgi:hypothetical protein